MTGMIIRNGNKANMTGMVRRVQLVLVLAAPAVLALHAGCQTDPIFPDGRPPEGTLVVMPQSLAPRDVSDEFMKNVREADLVEDVVTQREAYRASLRDLRDAAARSGNNHRHDQASYELAGLEKVQPLQYILDAEVPPATLRPVQSIPAADQLYDRAMKLMREGGHGIPALYRQEKMLEALKTLKALIRDHPTSDKIDDAAFYCGEIHKEYLPDQELIAVRWYERSMEWDPKTPHKVRFQAAVIYDYRLHNRARALELYHAVLEDEKDIDITNTRFSSRRIDELMREARPGEPVSPGGAQSEQQSESGPASAGS